METMTLFGISITLIITILGWIVTYRTQLKILKVQIDYQSQKDRKRALIDDNFTFIQDLETWFEKGRKIYLASIKVLPLSMTNLKRVVASDIDEKERMPIIRQIAPELENAEKVVEELMQLRAEEPRLFYLAKLYDPLANHSPLWDWGNPQMPNDLPQIINNFENEVMDQVFEMLYGENGRAFPKVEDQFYALHEAGIQAIERVKNYIVDQEITKGDKKK